MRAAPLRVIAVAYDALLNGLAVASGVLLGIISVAVIGDVIMRNIGFQPPPHTVALTEYGLLYITLLAAPWLLRNKGHVYIEIGIARAGPRLRRALAVLTYALCLASCLILLVYSIDLTILNWTRGGTDIRSFDMPRWLLFLPMPVSFAMLSVEFVRFLIGCDSMYDRAPPVH